MNYYTYLKTFLKEVFLQHSKSKFNKKYDITVHKLLALHQNGRTISLETALANNFVRRTSPYTKRNWTSSQLSKRA